MHDAWRKLYMTFALYILFKGEMCFKIDFCQDEKKKNENLAFFFMKSFVGLKKVLTFAPAKREQRSCEALRKEFFDRFT